jgi:AcrR family transcriptional regulator
MADAREPPDLGLRERKKHETRLALTWAAVRLAVERGFDDVLVEDIAGAAGVSARTFNNYFSSKAEAIAARHLDRLGAIAEALHERDPAEPLWGAITAVVVGEFSARSEEDGPPEARWAVGIRVMMREPAVQAEVLRGSRVAERRLAVVVAARIGADPDSLYPQLVAAATGMAIGVALEQWLRADSDVGLTRILRRAIEQTSKLAESPARARRAPAHAGAANGKASKRRERS